MTTLRNMACSIVQRISCAIPTVRARGIRFAYYLRTHTLLLALLLLRTTFLHSGRRFRICGHTISRAGMDSRASLHLGMGGGTGGGRGLSCSA